MFYRSNQINKMADAPVAPVPLGGADPIAHAAPFVTPAEALGAEMVVIIDALMENNRRMMGVRPHPWCAPQLVPADIARERAEMICERLYPYFLLKLGRDWCGIDMTPAMLSGIVKRILRYRGSWVDVAPELVDDWLSRAATDFHIWVRAMAGWHGTLDHCRYLLENIQSAYLGKGADVQRAKRVRNNGTTQLLGHLDRIVQTLGQAGLLLAAPGGALVPPAPVPPAPVPPAPVPAHAPPPHVPVKVAMKVPMNFVPARAPRPK